MLGFGYQAEAQKDTVKVELDGVTVEVSPGDEEIEELVKVIRDGARKSQEIIQAQREEMNKINKEYEAGEISRNEAERRRAQLVEETEEQLSQLEEEIEEAAEKVGEQAEKKAETEIERVIEGQIANDFESAWEEEAKEFEEKSGEEGAFEWDFDEEGDDDDDDWDFDDDWDWNSKKKNQKKTNFIFDLHGGFNTLLDENGNTLGGDAQLDNWRSNIWEIGFNSKTRMGGPSSKAYIKYGISFTWHDWTLKGNNVISKDSINGGQVSFGKADVNVRHSEWRTAYVNIPIMFQLDLSERGMDNGFTLGVGGYGGLRMYSLREIKYNDFQDDRTKDKNYNNFYMNNWRYGLMAQIGFDSFKITAQYDMNPLFERGAVANGTELGDLRNLSLSVGWSF